jgi:hypothetical protein
MQVAWTALSGVARQKSSRADREKFLEKLDYIFPISSCTHKIISCLEASCQGCEAGAHLLNCGCRKEKKIPVIELKFMLAMQAHRPAKASMMIAGADKVESERQEKAVRRKEVDEERRAKKQEKEKEQEKDLEHRSVLEEEMLLCEGEEEGEKEDETLPGAMKPVRNTLKLPQTALAAIRTDASNRQAAAICSGLVQDLISGGVLPAGSEHLMVDQKKIHRAKEAMMRKVQDRDEKRMQEEDIMAIMVDARYGILIVNIPSAFTIYQDYQDQGPHLQ